MTVVHQILWVVGWPFRMVLLGLILGYQRFVSPLFGPSCRYHPVCSAYAYRAIARHGAFKGSVLTSWRLVRCNPWSKGGVDPVPDRGHWLPPVYPDGTARRPKAMGGAAAGAAAPKANQPH